MPTVLAYDIYGTLIDTRGVLQQLQLWIPNKASEFVTLWRDKQLEYSFRRGLMRSPCDFTLPTRDALDFCCERLGCPLTAEQRDALMAAYGTLPAYSDVLAGLAEAQASGIRLCALSNGSQANVTQLLKQAGVLHYFEQVLSVASVGSFKPHPQVYQHLLNVMQVPANDCWLVSGNPFDVIGANHQGLQTAWIQRHPQQVFDVWSGPNGPVKPQVTATSLKGLSGLVLASQGSRQA